MLSIVEVTDFYKQNNLYNNINITILPGAIVNIKGANGAGKTCLLRTIAGIKKPFCGQIFYGFNKTNISDVPKPFCTYIGHNLGLKLELTVRDHLKFWANIHNSFELIDVSIYYFKLQQFLDKKCYELSSGEQKRIALSKLFICQTDLWILDEAESNLDSQHKSLLDNLIITKANNGGIILITSHGDLSIKSAQVIDIEDYK